MDYKEKYEQALGRARNIRFGNPQSITANVVCGLIFPELKENEDEIFKELVYNLIVSNDSTPSSKEIFSTYGKTKEDLHAWLEKQGKQSLEDKVNEAMREVEEKAKAFTAKHKGETTEEILAQMRGEQKPADKVESKFKFGDWINKDGAIWRIEGVCGKEYILGGRPDVIIQEPIHIIDSEFRLWTIQDAKDGDVLAIEPIKEYPSPFIAIYKERGLDFFNSHCFIAFDGVFHKPTMGHTIDLIHPATKEQRDILFAKMQEAGYEWDSEKKELKEIEQKPTWSEEDDEWMKSTFDKLSLGKDMCLGERNWIQSLKERMKGE